MLPAASFVLTSNTVRLPSVGAPCILPVFTIVIATQLLKPHITERELPSPRLFSGTMFVKFNLAPHSTHPDRRLFSSSPEICRNLLETNHESSILT